MTESDTEDDAPAATSEEAALQSAVDESHRTFDKQIATLEEIDDKAMRSVRTAVIVLGFVVSAVGIAGPSSFSSIGLTIASLTSFGVLSLVGSIIFGVGTYTVTQYPSGIGDAHRTDVITGGYSEKEWYTDLLHEYSEWSDEVSEEIETNTEHLERVQLLLIVGVGFLLLSSALTVFKKAYQIPPGNILGTLGLLLTGFWITGILMRRRS